jgi:hypothetical protein
VARPGFVAYLFVVQCTTAVLCRCFYIRFVLPLIEGGEITRQIKLAFEVPYKDAKAEEHYINTVIVIINGSVSAQAKTILDFYRFDLTD